MGRELVPYAQDRMVKHFAPADAVVIPVANITASQVELAAGIEGLQLACATAPATGVIDLDLPFEQASLTPGLGVELTDIVVCYGVTGAALTAAPGLALSTVTFAPAGAAAAAPAVAAVAGITTTPGVLPTAVSAAGQQYTAQFSLANALARNTDLQKLVARLTAPLAVGGNFQFYGAFAHFTRVLAQA